MFEFIHPSVTRGSSLQVADLMHFTRNVAPSSGEAIQVHYQAVHRGFLANHKNAAQASGLLFEQCIYDAICRAGIHPDWIRTGVDLADGNNAEVDFLITPPGGDRVAIFAKVSLRERWKQVDRDAMVIGYRHNDLRNGAMTLLFLAEKPGHTVAQATRKAAVTQRQCYAPLGVLTVVDHPAMATWLGGLTS